MKEKKMKYATLEEYFWNEDKSDCCVEIHSCAGGEEARNWSDLLARMYTRWAHSCRFPVEKIDGDIVFGSETKSIFIFIFGLNSYGFLKNESGVHCLVRISPFTRLKRRHQSFASVLVHSHQRKDVPKEIRQKYLNEKTDWTNKIRSYIFDPYEKVHDLRTGFKTSRVQDVLDGNLSLLQKSITIN